MKIKYIIKILAAILFIFVIDLLIRLLFGMDFYSVSQNTNLDFNGIYDIYSFSNISECYSKLDSVYVSSTSAGWNGETVNQLFNGIIRLDYRMLSSFILPFIPLIFLIIFILSGILLKKKLSNFNLDSDKFSSVHSKKSDY